MKKGEIYKKRILDAVLERKLSGAGAVLVEGPERGGRFQLLYLGLDETERNGHGRGFGA